MGAAHVWRVTLAPPASWPSSLRLAPGEQAHADRLRNEEGRNRWICSRLALRTIVAAYCECEQGEIRFEQGPFGKPRLAENGRGASRVHFNLTRSGDLCLVAVSRDYPVGIDVERLDGAGGEDLIARRFFTSREAEWIARLEGQPKNKAFLEIWTRKEAYLKATGLGLQPSLGDVDVSPSENSPGIHSIAGPSSTTWRLIPLFPAAGYVATLALPLASTGDGNGDIEMKTFRFAQELGFSSRDASWQREIIGSGQERRT